MVHPVIPSKETASLDISKIEQSRSPSLNAIPQPHVSGFFDETEIERIIESFHPLVKPEEKVSKVRDLLKEPKSAFERIRSLIPIPASINPIVDLLMAKGNKYDVRVGVEGDFVTLATDIKLPSEGLTATAKLSIPLTPQPANDTPVEIHPVILASLNKALSPLVPKDQKMDQILQLVSTLPSQILSLTWMNGEANITINLPSGVELKLKFNLPSSAEAAGKPDILRTFLKSILKESYPGIESLLSKDMLFIWDGKTSQFKIQFPQQLALKINKLDLENTPFRGLIQFLGKDTTVVIPQTISGTINFKDPSIQFTNGLTLEVKKKFPFLDKDIILNKISFDSAAKKVKLAFGNLLIPDINIDLKETSEKKPSMGTNVIDFSFIPYNSPPSKKAVEPSAVAPAPVKPPISVLESLKQMIKIPAPLLPLISMVLVDKTNLDVAIGIEDEVTLSTDINIAKLGITGEAHLTIPTVDQLDGDVMPAKLQPEIEGLLRQKLSTLASEEQLSEIMDLLLTLPNQQILMNWFGNSADLTVTLPGGMVLRLILNIPQKEGQRDVLRTFLSEVLKDKFAGIEPFLSETFIFKWDGSTSKFSIQLDEQQELKLKSLQLKRGNWLKNLLGDIVGWIVKSRSVIIPQLIEGKLDLEEGSVSFNKGTTFIVKGPLGIAKRVGLKSLAFDPKNKVHLELGCFGRHAVVIDLNKSHVDDFDFEINRRR